jgi:hypothetical protein
MHMHVMQSKPLLTVLSSLAFLCELNHMMCCSFACLAVHYTHAHRWLLRVDDVLRLQDSMPRGEHEQDLAVLAAQLLLVGNMLWQLMASSGSPHVQPQTCSTACISVFSKRPALML